MNSNNGLQHENNILLELDNLIIEQYIDEIDKIYKNYENFCSISRLYSLCSKIMNIFNIASIFLSILLPSQNYSLIFSLVGISLNSMFSIDLRKEKLQQIVSVYYLYIIPDLEKFIYDNISKDIRQIRNFQHEITAGNINNKISNINNNNNNNNPSLSCLDKIAQMKEIITNNYTKYMGEMFSVPVSLTYVNYTSIILCFSTYIFLFITIPLIHIYLPPLI